MGLILAVLVDAPAQVTVSAVKQFDQLMRNYNAVVLNDASFNNSNIEGAVAVGGNLSITNGSVAYLTQYYPNGGEPTLYVNGQLTVSGDTKVQSGYASTPHASGSFYQNANQRHFTTTSGGGMLNMDNSPDPRTYTSPVSNPTPANWNWATIGSQATSLSSQLAAAAATGIIGVGANQTLTFSSPNATAGVVVFNLNAALLNGNTYGGQIFSNFGFAIGANQTFVVNVINASGKTLFSGANFNPNNFTGVGGAGQLLWNITGSGNVTIASGGEFYGSIVAPQATLVDNGNVRFNGQVLASGMSYSGAQLHYTNFSPAGTVSSVLVPEPSTYACWMAALCGVGLWWHRRRAAHRG